MSTREAPAPSKNPVSSCSLDSTYPSRLNSLPDVLQHLWEINWSGPVHVHFQHGLPTFVEFGVRRVKMHGYR